MRLNHPPRVLVAMLAFPVKGTFLPGKEDRGRQDRDKDEHIEECYQSHTLEDHCPGKHVDHLHIKSHEEQGQDGIAQAKLYPGFVTCSASVLRRWIVLLWAPGWPQHTAQCKCEQT